MRKHLHWPDKTGPLFCECHCKCFRAWASRNSDTLTPAHHCYVKVPYEQHVQGHKGICLHGVPQQVARNWKPSRKRITATIACMNTSLIGILVGIYAGEVPRIQYVLADEAHHALIGNVALYLGLALSTFTFWPLPLLHGRKPYVLTAMALALPLQFPQAMVLSTKRSPKYAGFRASLLLSRGISGLVLGFANANFVTVLLDLFGASLQSKHPHQEVPNAADLRKHGGGLGLWLGIWSWCWIGTLAIGFQIGASIIQNHTPDRGFYVTIIINALALVLNILASETRRSKNRRSVVEVYDRRYNILTRCVVRGEVRLHLSTRGPRHFIDELYAGMRLSFMMCCQKGFFILAIYLGWIYGQIILVIMLLGALLSREYKWKPHQIGFGVMSVAIGALLAIPLTKANVFNGKRASLLLTSRKLLGNQVTWTSHSVRRAFFIALLPILGLGFSVSCGGPTTPFVIPILFAGAIGFASVLAVAECYGLIMETFDVCDLPLGMQIPHLMKSHSSTTQDGNRQSAYSSFPRVTAGIFVSQTFAFVGAAVATAVGGILSRRISTQLCTGIMAGILLLLTIFLIAVLWRFRDVRVISSHTSKAKSETTFSQTTTMAHNGWEDVMSGSPPRRIRRMNILEMGALSRWTEIRRLNYLIRPKEEKRRWVG
ncbi:MFS general substrate transporter [Aaosphaeria arxii CBS 175.79]|uniref:MFS general substrate transporter n=1 Tax=Aaosphaeria arxii CBS 175.79 TaxID=1450172 RepID=A0A6A5XWX6_9PLEO|nr:MFS general substrate transporter [Aaosphaeria arxii CBS 175.79]KAF2017662.1 MFS general substrate transporter [Aaosphaeria arxii CBS 175.79]